jgi:hypothetical protein
LIEEMVVVCVDGSTKEISRTNASSEPPKSYARASVRRETIPRMERQQTYLHDPHWCPLLATEHPLCPNDAGGGVHRAVEDIHGHNMRTVRIRVLMPHPDDDMCP